MQVQDRWHVEEPGHVQKDELSQRAAAERHMDVGGADATPCARDRQADQAGGGGKGHPPERSWPIRIKNAHVYIGIGTECREQIARHTAHPAATLTSAR